MMPGRRRTSRAGSARATHARAAGGTHRRRRPRRGFWDLLDAATSDLPELCGCDLDRAVTCPACALDTSGALAPPR